VTLALNVIGSEHPLTVLALFIAVSSVRP